MVKLLLVFALLYALLCAAMYKLQRKLMYLPDRNIDTPESYGLDHVDDLRVVTTDGLMLQLWYYAAKPGMPTIIYFHGNAAHLGNRAGKFAAFVHDGFGVLALSYRGYGASGGSPSEEGLYIDARTAIAYAMREKNISLSHILLYGESLGSGVATQMATEYKVGALILEAPYTSVTNRAAEIYSYLPVRLLIQDHYNSIAKIGKVASPVLVFHGMLDATIPIAHGQMMFRAANEPKQAHFFPHIGHTDFDSGLISSHVLEFARDHALISK